MTAHEGGCLCGRLRYRVEEPITSTGYCHCRLCQRSAGAPVLAWLTVERRRFVWTGGTPTVYRSSPRGQRLFCRDCGTQIVFRGAPEAPFLDVTIPSLDHPAAVAPQYHIWTESRIPWFETADSLPRHVDRGPDE